MAFSSGTKISHLDKKHTKTWKVLPKFSKEHQKIYEITKSLHRYREKDLY